MQNYVFFIFKEAVFLLFPCRSAKVLSAIKEIPSDKENEKDHANMTHACPRLRALEIWLGIRAVESPVPLLGWWFMEATSLSLSPSHPIPFPFPHTPLWKHIQLRPTPHFLTVERSQLPQVCRRV